MLQSLYDTLAPYLILACFALFVGLMYRRTMPAMVALPAMALAMVAWRRVPTASGTQLPIRVLVGALAITATVATSTIETLGFTRIEIVDGEVVAGAYFEVDEVYDEAADDWSVANDAQSTGLLNGTVDEELCHASGLCLRGTRDGSVEESVDGGTTWRTACPRPCRANSLSARTTPKKKE